MQTDLTKIAAKAIDAERDTLKNLGGVAALNLRWCNAITLHSCQTLLTNLKRIGNRCDFREFSK